MNREKGPDQVLDLAATRLASGSGSLDTLLPMVERASIAARYKQVAGFDPATLNRRDSYFVDGSPPRG
jgi:hypothetical protein